MSQKIFNIQLPCGCLIAEDTGTPEKPDGNAGCLPCHYDDSNEEQVALCEKSWKEWRRLKK